MNYYLFVLTFTFLNIVSLKAQNIQQPKNRDKLARYPAYKMINTEECGPVKVGNRIIGGKAARLGQYPWIAALGYVSSSGKIEFHCGGALITPTFVVTAAHCIMGDSTKLQIIRLGEHFTNETVDCEDDICAPSTQDMPVKKMFSHPSFDSVVLKHDIAIIQLNSEVKYNDYVKPICLPHGSLLKKSFVTSRVEVAGWGITSSDTLKRANTLLTVTLPVRDLCACYPYYSDSNLDKTQFCVGTKGGRDSCNGDSGGPMMKLEAIAGKKRYHLIGIVSYGMNYCGESPAIYTNVATHIDWILDTISKNI